MNNTDIGKTYFAAMNTPNGFVSFFHEVFSHLNRLYIIKGGPGTGKSRMMRNIAKYASESGYRVENILCSSDPTSLDGVIIPELSLGFLDGTSPHVYEASPPGAKDNIVDLGQFWNSEILTSRRAEIDALNSAKSRLFSSVYGHLRAAKECSDSASAIVRNAILYEKLDREISRLAEKAVQTGSVKRKSRKTVRVRSAISCDGIITLPFYAEVASKRYAISDPFGIGLDLLSELMRRTEASGCDIWVSYSPFRPDAPDALYFPESDVSFYIGSEGDYEEKHLNMRRFIDKSRMSPYRSKLRSLSKLRSEHIFQLKDDYLAIKRLHAELEHIYSSSMDFSAKEELEQTLLDKINI